MYYTVKFDITEPSVPVKISGISRLLIYQKNFDIPDFIYKSHEIPVYQVFICATCATNIENLDYFYLKHYLRNFIH